MPKRRANGDGNIRKRKDGRWEGRYTVGHDSETGSIPLAELTSLDLRRFYKHLLEGGRVDRIAVKKKPKGLASKTVRNIHQIICSAYNFAMGRQSVFSSLCARLLAAHSLVWDSCSPAFAPLEEPQP